MMFAMVCDNYHKDHTHTFYNAMDSYIKYKKEILR